MDVSRLRRDLDELRSQNVVSDRCFTIFYLLMLLQGANK
jgi:hypothetical protein